MAAEFRYNYLNYIIMFICIDKTETIHHFKLLFCRKSAEFTEKIKSKGPAHLKQAA